MRIDAILTKQRLEPERTRFIGNDGYEMFAERLVAQEAAQHAGEAHRRGGGTVSRSFEKLLELIEARRLQRLDLHPPLRK